MTESDIISDTLHRIYEGVLTFKNVVSLYTLK